MLEVKIEIKYIIFNLQKNLLIVIKKIFVINIEFIAIYIYY